MKTSPLHDFASSNNGLSWCTKDGKAVLLLKKCSASRTQLLHLLSKGTSSMSDVSSVLNTYLSYLLGIVDGSNNNNNNKQAQSDGDSPNYVNREGLGNSNGSDEVRQDDSSSNTAVKGILNNNAKMVYRWGNLMGEKYTESHDANFEVNSMLLEVALFYIKSFQQLLNKRDLNFDFDMRLVATHFRDMKTCTSILLLVSQRLENSSGSNGDFNNDLNPRIIKALYLQVYAQLQEITLQIGIHRKSCNEYLAKISYDIYTKYKQAYELITKSSVTATDTMRFYSLFKCHVFHAYTYILHANSFLANNQCGIAVRSYRQAKNIIARAANVNSEYLSKRTESSNFLHSIQRIIERGASKCESENSMIYKQPIPSDVAPLVGGQEAVKIEPFTMPQRSNEWSPRMYQAFKSKQ